MTDEKRKAGTPSEEAKEQLAIGQAGGPREARGGEQGSGGQNPQGAERNSPNEQETPELREGYEAASSPSKQGDGDPRPQEAASSDSLQGIGSQSGSHSARGERTTEEAESGEPKDAHTREGREQTPGDRERS
jgi:hypothetical protein